MGDESGLVVYECRRCGRSLESDEERCPSCGGAEVARFVI